MASSRRKKWEVRSVATVNPKRFDVETRLIINLLDYFKNEPAKRPTHASPVERGRNERCNIIKKKAECVEDETCEWRGIMHSEHDCLAKDPCFKHDGNKKACKADKKCTYGSTRHYFKFYDCSLANQKINRIIHRKQVKMRKCVMILSNFHNAVVEKKSVPLLWQSVLFALLMI